VLLVHLLKWQLQVGFRSRSWSATVREQRREIVKLLPESPSLRNAADPLLPEAYAEAREKTADETGLAEGTFPADCPFSLDQIVAEDFLPEP
jgi:hypothetical protein